ncbi:flagellar filament capping protein FliD [Phycisphaeraceae bacterium D3-23]
MGQITTGVGLISGLDIAGIVDQLVSIEARPRTLLQNRNEVLRSQQVAFQEINARLLSLKNASSGFSGDALFSSTVANSSNDNVLTASSGVGAVPGTYSFIVNRLVAAQQTISQGFADASSTPVAPSGTTLTFDRGEARLDSQTRLANLNGGAGINRGFIRITDRSGATALVDLTSVVTVDDVIDKINQTTGANVFAEVDGDRLRVTDASGSTAGDLLITDVGVTATATSLGLAGNGSTDGVGGDDSLTGLKINTVGEDTLLASLNDGKGVRGGVGTAFTITAAGGATVNVDLANALTLGDVFEQIETQSGGVLSALANADGTGIQIIDSSGGGGGFAITAGGAPNALADLGLVVGADNDADGVIAGGRVIAGINSKLVGGLFGGQGVAGITGEGQVPVTTATNIADLFQGTGASTNGDGNRDIQFVAKDNPGQNYNFDLDAYTTLGDFFNAVSTNTGGRITLSIQNRAIVVTDNTGGAGKLSVNDGTFGATSATTLGIAGVHDGNVATGVNLDPQGTPVSGSQVDFTNSLGVSTTIDFGSATSVADILDSINDSGLGLTASVNSAGTGIQIVDNAGGLGDLIIADSTGSAAQQLGIEGSFAQGVADTGDLEFSYLNGGTRLDALGVERGRFTIRDSDGDTATVDITQGNENTIDDLLSEINSRGLDILARVNDTGDGIIIEDLGSGAVAIEIEEDGSTTARDLGLLGTATAAGADFAGSFERTIDVSATDSLQDVANLINDANIGVSASVINDGSPAAPFRLSLSSETAGSGGAFTFDDGVADLGASTLSRAQDAVVFYGGNDPTNSIIIESKSNTLSSVIPGADITLLTTSDQPTQVTIARDDEAVIASANDFVTGFNALIDTLDKYDSYDAEEEVRGLLLGDSTISRIRSGIYNAVINPNNALTGQFKMLAQVGIRVGAGAKLEFDETKFRQALQTDREAVEALFNFEQFEVDPDTGETTDTLVAQGIGTEIDKLLERLTDTIDGTVQRQLDVIDQQVQLNENRIEDLTDLLQAKRERLQAQFVAMERALADLQDQSSALSQIAAIQPIQRSS